MSETIIVNKDVAIDEQYKLLIKQIKNLLEKKII